MSNCNMDEKLSYEEEWAFVDLQGSVVPTKKLPSMKGKSIGMKKKSHQLKPKKDYTDLEPEFEVIQDNDLTTSAIIATTEIPPFGKHHQHDGDNLRMAKNLPVNCNITGVLHNSSHESSSPVENFSDSSSTSSFDIIEENKTKGLSCGDTDVTPICDVNQKLSVAGPNFHFDSPTLLALFCLTTALGFVIGHGIGIATSYLVVKMPNLKIPPRVTGTKTSNSLPEVNTEKCQVSQLEGNIEKWKATYRNDKTTQGQNDISEMSLQRAMPGLKEAHKHVSLENFKLKKANEEIQKQLDQMKVMSRHRRLQLDNLKMETKQNKSHVVEVLMKELEYLEMVYLREKRLADQWRNEQERRDKKQEKQRSNMHSWKQFKERWSGVQKKESSESSNTPTASFEDSCGVGGDCEGTYTDVKEPIAEKVVEKGKEDSFMDYKDILGESMSQELRSDTKNVQDGNENEMEVKEKYKEFDTRQVLVEGTSGGDSKIGKDEEGSAGMSRTNRNLVDTNEAAVSPYEETPFKDVESNKMTSETLKDNLGSDWFQREVMETEDDTVVAYENKDVIKHKLYGFWDGNFHEVVSSRGDIFVMSVRKGGFNASHGFVVSVQNDSPKPIDFIAVLPNGKVKHQHIGGEVKVTMVNLGLPGEQGLAVVDSEEKPFIYEAVVTANGKLGVTPQDDYRYQKNEGKNQKSEGKNLENKVVADEKTQDEKKKAENTDESNKVEENASNQGSPSPYQTVPKSFLRPGETYLVNEFSGTFYRRIVTMHYYPISEYRNVLSQNPGKQERVFYRFPGNFIIEKFVVRDELMNKDDEESKGEENEKLAVQSEEGVEPREHDKDVSSIVERFLEDRWEEGNKMPALMKFDHVTGSVTSVYLTLRTVSGEDVISHQELKHGKIEKNGNKTEMTSYRMTGYELVRIIRIDEVYNGHTIPNDQDATGAEDRNDNGSGVAKKAASENERSFKKENSTENQDISSNEGSFVYKEHEETIPGQKNPSNQHSETTEAGGNLKIRKAGDACSLELGESKENEYWTICDKWNVLVIKEKMERVKESSLNKEEDIKKLSVQTKNVEETMSYVYCGDGSVEKAWRLTEKIGNDKIFDPEEKGAEKTVSVDENGVVCLDNKNCKMSPEDGNEATTATNQPKKENIDANVLGKVEMDQGTEKFGKLENVEFDEDKNKQSYEDDHDGDEHHYNDDINIDDRQFKKKFESSTMVYWGNQGMTSDDGVNQSSDLSPKNSEKLRRKYKSGMQVDGKADYNRYLKSEWRNLKMRQRQFENSKQENLRLQKTMTEEWKRMKEEYREFQKHLRNTPKSQTQMETERTWRDMKDQQRQFENWKTQVLEELRNNLKEEWKKLEKVHKEVEMKEKRLKMEKEAILQSYKMKLVEYPRSCIEVTERDVSDSSGNVDKSASLAWELTDNENDKLVHKEKPQAIQGMPTKGPKREMNNLELPTKITAEDTGIENESDDFRQVEKLAEEVQFNILRNGKPQTQFEIQTKRLREELDRLYENKFSISGFKRNGNELQITIEGINSADWSVQKDEYLDGQSQGKDWIQPKCPLKCPQNSEDSTRESKVEVISTPEGPPADEGSPEVNDAKKLTDSGYVLFDVIRGYEYLRKAEEDEDLSWKLKDGAYPPKDTTLKALKKKKYAKKRKNKDRILTEKARKTLPKKEKKVNVKDRRDDKGRQKASTQNDRFFESPNERKEAKKQEEHSRYKWVHEIR